jgi:hypothetical protein
MNYPMQQNYGGGLGALGPVQSMSDRNDAQMMMVNRGQMFANGGIAALAEGGTTKAEDLLPKYKFNPLTQRYELDESKKEAAGLAELVPRGGDGSSVTPARSAWDDMTDVQKAAFFSTNPVHGMVTRGLQGLFSNTILGAAQRAFNPAFVERQEAIARGMVPGTFGTLLADNENPGMATTNYGSGFGLSIADNSDSVGRSGEYGSGFGLSVSDNTDSAGRTGGYSPAGGGEAPSTSSEAAGGVGGDYGGADTGDGWASGGIASLAYGGRSHLGDYSDGGRLLRGPGDGVSDSIPASIGGKRPARLADGEFVVPARIVSELGNGSTEAGARKLYAMMDRIQRDRSKTVGKDRVAVNSRAAKNLPA